MNSAAPRSATLPPLATSAPRNTMLQPSDPTWTYRLSLL